MRSDGRGTPASGRRRGRRAVAAPAAALAGLALAMAGAIAFSGKAIIVKLAYRYGVDAVTLIMYRMLFALPLFAAARLVGRARQAGADAARLARRCSGSASRGYYLASFLDFAGLQYITRQPRAADPLPQPDAGAGARRAAVSSAACTRASWSRSRVSYCGVLLVFGHEVSLRRARTSRSAPALVFASAVSYAVYLVCSGEEVKRLGALRLTGLATSVACLFCIAQFLLLRPIVGAGGRARGDLAVGAQRDALHLRAGADGDDGDRAHRRRAGGADRHDRPAVDDR